MGMRITNQMVTGNSLRNMQKSMSEVNKTTQQMTTGKKISKASEDPVTAIRALKLRTTVNQLEQYKNKNIPDAQSWLDISQTSFDNITKRITDINDYCVQGSTDSFNTSDRQAIIESLESLQRMIYDEGNSTYAGRYIFSGYKTDRSLAFTETDDKSKFSYDITEHFSATDFDTKNIVLSEVDYSKVDSFISNPNTYNQPNPEMVYRLNLGYENIDDTDKNNAKTLSIVAFDSNKKNIDLSSLKINVKSVDDVDTYYSVGDNDINVIEETGEIILGKSAYNLLKTAADVQITYSKNKFDAGDLRPEHYYDCTQHTVQADGTVKDTEYTKDPEGQPVYYEVNFNQKIQVNTEGSKIISPEIGNYINDLVFALKDLEDAEISKTKLEGMLTETQYASNEDAVTQINRMLSDLDVEIAVKKENMQKKFSENIANFQSYLSEISAMQSDLGSRMSKLSMIETRVTEQFASFKELKSQNEDIETDSAIIDFNQANLVYNSALAATSNVMDKTLLDYL